MEGNYRRNTKMGKTNRLEKRVKEGKIQCVRQKMAGYLRSYSTLIFSLRYYWLKQRQSSRRRAYIEGEKK